MTTITREGKPSRKHNPKWRDNTFTKRQSKRRESLNQIAKQLGFDSWSKMETQAINGSILIRVERIESCNHNLNKT